MRWLGVAVVLASGCTCLDLKQGRTYPCTPGGPLDQCAEGWVCGLEGRCHDLDAGPYKCIRDAQCTGGWVCALDGVCKDPNLGVPSPCITSNNCTGGWLCGLEKVCHDPDAGAPYQCTSDAWCAPGWMCGLEQICHAIDAGAPYLCTVGDGGEWLPSSDGWCAPGWACTKLGRCAAVNPAEVRLTSLANAVDAGNASLLYEALSPGLLWEAPQAVAFSFEWGVAQGPFTATTAQNLGFVDDGGVTILARTVARSTLSDGGQDQFVAYWEPLDAGVVAMAATPSHVYVQTAAALLAFPPVPPGCGLEACSGPAPVSLPLAAQHLRQPQPTPGGPELVGFSSGGTYWALGEDAGFAVLDTGTLPLRPGANLTQLTSYLAGPSCPDPLRYLAVDDLGGVFASSWSPGLQRFFPWSTLSLPGLGGATVTNLQAAEGVLAGVVQDSLGTHAMLWALDGGACAAPAGVQMPECPPDNSSQDLTFDRIHPFSRDGTPAVEVYNQGNPLRAEPHPFNGGCSLFGLLPYGFFTDALVPADAMPARVAYASYSGVLAVGRSFETAEPFTPDQVANAIVGTQDMVVTFVGPEQFSWQPPGGYLRTTTQLFPQDIIVASFSGDPYAALYQNGKIDNLALPNILPIFLGPSVSSFQPPYAAAATSAVDGTEVFVVTTGDLVLGALAGSAASNNGATLELRAVPASGSVITSVALTPPVAGAGGESVISGYALTVNGLHQFQGPIESPSWATSALDVGPPAITMPQPIIWDSPVKVFGDGTRAYLGLADGAVFSLPSLIQVSPNLNSQIPPGTPDPPLSNLSTFFQASDFGMVCGSIYVMTFAGAYRLEPVAGQRLGQWVADLPLDATLAPRLPNPPLPLGGGFFGAGDELFLSSTYGSIGRLRADGCAQ